MQQTVHFSMSVVLFQITKPGNVELIPLKSLVGVLDYENIFTRNNKTRKFATRNFPDLRYLAQTNANSVPDFVSELTSSGNHEILYAK